MATRSGESNRPKPGRSRTTSLLRSFGAVVYSLYVTVGIFIGLTFLGSVAWASASARDATANPGPSVISSVFKPLEIIFPPADADRAAEVDVVAFWPDWAGSERINILLLGIDQRDDERESGLPTRSDTLIVVSIDPITKSAAMISFPRDLWVQIPGFAGREERINAAYRFGELSKQEGGGPGAAARTIEANFGLKVPYYAIVDFRGFQEVVNLAGGVVVDVPRPLRDDEYPTEDYGVERVYFAPGPQLMDGITALKYARTRHADNDFGRMARQQQVLMALRDRALSLNILPQLPSVMGEGMRTVKTNFTVPQLLGLGKLARDIDTTAVGTLVVDNQLVTPYRSPLGADLLLPKKDEIRRAIFRALADPRLLREAAKIEVMAAAPRSQVAQQTADRVAAEGLTVIRQTSPLQSEPEATRVLVYHEKSRSVDAILRTLGLPPEAVVDASAEESNIDIRVMLGREFVLPPAN